MRFHTLTRSQTVPVPPQRAFAFFADPGNLEAITPRWLRFRVLPPVPRELAAGTRIEYRLVLHRIPVRWTTEITVWEPGRRFSDVQLRGPYAVWEHTHAFEPCADGTAMIDVVRYALPYGPLGSLAHSAFVRRDLARIFDFRAAALANRRWP